MHEVLVNRLGGLSLPRKSVDRLSDRPDMTLDVYRGRKTTMQQQYRNDYWYFAVRYKTELNGTETFHLKCICSFREVINTIYFVK